MEWMWHRVKIDNDHVHFDNAIHLAKIAWHCYFYFFLDFEREDVLETDILSGKRMPNSFSTTIETTTYRGHQLMEETPGTSSNMRAALRGVEFIAQHIKNQDKDNEVRLMKNSTCKAAFLLKSSAGC